VFVVATRAILATHTSIQKYLCVYKKASLNLEVAKEMKNQS